MPLKIEEPDSNIAKNHESDTIIGIDLGTTNSLIGIVKNNKIKLFCDDLNNDIIPSIVNFDENGNFIDVGIKKSQNSISSIKRLIGKSYNDLKNSDLEFEISKKNNLTIKIADKFYRPEEISAFILCHLKDIAQKHLKKEVTKCVITVPAYFDEAAKYATKHSAEIAGLEVVRLVNEPSAAAIAFGLDQKANGKYIVYDLGGGTFDISLLKMQEGVFHILGVRGDNEFGGDDIDRLIIEKFNKIDKSFAKQIKEAFLKQDNITINNQKFTKEEFHDLIDDKIKKTISLTIDLLDDLDINKNDIDGVILVGGSTRISLIKDKLSKIFSKNKIYDNIDPDRVVARGACWQAHNLSGLNDNLLLDVVPLSIGIEMMGGIVDKIIHRNTTTPCAYAKEFTTYADNQTGMKFHIVQGEREMAKDCRSIAHFEIKNILPMAAGLAKILVTFQVDADGLLTVSALDQITKQKKEIIAKPTYNLDDNKVKNMLIDSLKNSKEDINKRIISQLITDSKKDISIIKKDLKNYPTILSEKQKQELVEIMDKLESLFKNNPTKLEIENLVKIFHKKSHKIVLSKVNKTVKMNFAGKNIEDFNN
ncbi:MAG: Fe-S protein assembly chaperone HscA [Rickettsiales bacterium]|nr:Fe-S protein assembly chaperone HscA [Rickettsiales bacterium]